jgi:sodium-dependent dicarboxylate transporter 2/3/5
MKLMIPATLSASCAFMLPVATAPNAVVFGTGRFSTYEMARQGFGLNLLAACALTLLCAAIL